MNRILSGALVALLVALLVAACGPTTADLGAVATPPPTEEPSIALPSDEPTPGQSSEPSGAPGESPGPGATPDATPDSSGGASTVRAYFFLGSFTDNAGLVPVLREIPRTRAVGSAAMRALFKGPNDAELGARPAMYTDVPDGTSFLGLTIDAGRATVNVSKEFESGGGAASVRGRLAQVVYTLTQFPNVTSVAFLVDGRAPLVFTSDYAREDFGDVLPAIFVDRPAWGGVLANPGRITGTANVFEAEFRLQILDGAGRALADAHVTATCGTGCRGAFDVTVPYSVAKASWGTLRVFEPSAKDGSPVGVTEYPVWLTQ
jgi:germination protein M